MIARSGLVRHRYRVKPMRMSLQPGVVSFPPCREATSMAGKPCRVASLTDEFGNGLIDAWMAQRGIDKSAITPLDRLAYLGKRAMGALKFQHNRGSRTVKSTAVELDYLVLAGRAALAGRFTGAQETQAALKSLLQVETNAGVQRAKAVVAFNPATQAGCFGQVEPPPGFSYWLLKLAGVSAAPSLVIAASVNHPISTSQLSARGNPCPLPDRWQCLVCPC